MIFLFFTLRSTDPIFARLRRSMKLRHTPIPTSGSVGDTSFLLSAVCDANLQTTVMVTLSIRPGVIWTAVMDLQRTHLCLVQVDTMVEGLVEVAIHMAVDH